MVRVPRDVLADEAGDEVVAVVVTRPHVQLEGVTGGAARVAQEVGAELAIEWDWESEFAAVRSSEAAGRLWSEARSAGVDRLELQRLVSIAQAALRSL